MRTIIAVLTMTLVSLTFTSTAWAHNNDENRNGDCRNTEEGASCSDDDFNNSRIIICVVPDSCRFGGDQ